MGSKRLNLLCGFTENELNCCEEYLRSTSGSPLFDPYPYRCSCLDMLGLYTYHPVLFVKVHNYSLNPRRSLSLLDVNSWGQNFDDLAGSFLRFVFGNFHVCRTDPGSCLLNFSRGWCWLYPVSRWHTTHNSRLRQWDNPPTCPNPRI